MWIRRVWKCKKELEALNVPFQGITVVRAMISRAIDNDDPAYTVASFAAFSFLFLGGLQLSYETTFISMIIVYAVMSLGDCLRIVLAMMSATSLKDVVQTSKIVHSKLRTPQASLNPSNVYEDLGRGKTIVTMVFITQVLLIAFVVRIDIVAKTLGMFAMQQLVELTIFCCSAWMSTIVKRHLAVTEAPTVQW